MPDLNNLPALEGLPSLDALNVPSLDLGQFYRDHEAKRLELEAQKAQLKQEMSGVKQEVQTNPLGTTPRETFDVMNSTPAGQDAIMRQNIPVDNRTFIAEGIERKALAALNVKKEDVPEVMEHEITPFNPVEFTFDHLLAREGVGDEVTDIETGKMGVTQMARLAVNAPDNMPDEEVAKAYLGKLDSNWSNRVGYKEAPPEVKSMLLDASYNMGEQVLKFKGVSDAIANQDYEAASKALLNTANVNKQTMIGLAKRRADSHNIAFPEAPIIEVEQKEDGTIIYRGLGGETLLEYNSKKGKHPKSKPGVIKLHGGDQ